MLWVSRSNVLAGFPSYFRGVRGGKFFLPNYLNRYLLYFLQHFQNIFHFRFATAAAHAGAGLLAKLPVWAVRRPSAAL